MSDRPSEAPAAPRITRRRLLIGGGDAIALLGGGLVAERELPLRRWYDAFTDACGDPGPIPPRSAAALTYDTFASEFVEGKVGYGLAMPPGHAR